MKRALIGLGAGVVLVIVLALAVPFLIPLDSYKAQLIALVKQSTGRELRINGPVKLSLLPQLEIDADDITLANVPGAAEPDMLRVKRLELRLRLLPLLRGVLAIGRFVLDEPVIVLELDKGGKPNWVVAGATARAPTPGGGVAFSDRRLADLRLTDLRLVQGKLLYRDDRTGAAWTLDDVALTMSLPDLDSVLAASGSAAWNGETVALSLAVARPRALIEGTTTGVEAKLAARPLTLGFTGAYAGGAPASLDGTIELNVPRLRDLALWLGAPVTGAEGKLALTGAIHLADVALAAPHFETARLERGSLSYGSGAAALSLGAIAVALSSSGADGALAGDASLGWNGKTVTLALTVAQPGALGAGGESAVTMKLAAPSLTFAYAGRITALPPRELAGTVELASPSLATLGRWLGAPLDEDQSLALKTGIALVGQEVTLDHGKLSYGGMQAGAAHVLDDIALKLSLAGPGGALAASGAALWDGERASLDLGIDQPSALRQGGQSALRLRLKTAPMELGFAGDVTGLPPSDLAGTLDLAIPSIVTLARWAGATLPAGMNDASLGFDGGIDLAGAALAEPRLEHLRVTGGTLRYRDAKTGASQALQEIAVALSLPMLDRPFAGDGSVVWNRQTVTLSLNLAAPRALLAGAPSAVAVNLAAAPATLGFTGVVTGLAPARLDGMLDLAVPSLAGFSDWTGVKVTIGPAKRLGVKGRIDLDGAKVGLGDAEITLDGVSAHGALALDASAARPYLSGALELAALDLNAFLPQPNAAPHPPGAEWSDQPFDLDGLSAVDADLTLRSGSIRFHKLTIDRCTLDIHLKDSKLAADLSDLQLYRGGGSGRVTLDAAGLPALTLALDLSGVAVEPLLEALADDNKITGTGHLTLDVQGNGKSELALVKSLAGKGAVSIANGTLKGVNIIALAANAASALTSITPFSKTDFVTLAGTVRIADGVVHNDDLKLTSGLIPVSGAGTINLASRTLDYRLTPSLIGVIGVPVLVRGRWEDPSYRPDIVGAVKGVVTTPGRVLDTIKGIFGK